MRVLWVTNFILPALQQELFGSQIFSGGWVVALAEDLAQVPEITLGITMPAPVEKVQELRRENILYYLVPFHKRNRHDFHPAHCQQVIDRFNPDMVHAHGTEFPRIKTFLDSWGGKAVVSVQGLRTGIKPYSTGGLNMTEMLLSGRPGQMLPAAVMRLQRYLYYRKTWIDLETSILKRAQAVMGRTTWDKAHVLNISPDTRYFHCNESLRASFYNSEWNLSSIQRHTLLKVAAQVPLKGMHHLLQAVALLVPRCPDIMLNVVDLPPYPKNQLDLKTRLGYPLFIRRMLRSLNLEPHVTYLGFLSEAQMVEQMTRTHAFVLSSSIENSPNTLGEAMMVGVPCVASYVGGIPDLAADGLEALLYRYDDPILLAHQITRIFDDDELALSLSDRTRQRARQTHDRQANVIQTLQIYHTLCSGAGEGYGRAIHN